MGVNAHIATMPSSMVELLVKVLNKKLAKDSLLWHYKNNYATNLMRSPVSVSNSLQLQVFSLVPWYPILYSVCMKCFAQQLRFKVRTL